MTMDKIIMNRQFPMNKTSFFYEMKESQNGFEKRKRYF